MSLTIVIEEHLCYLYNTVALGMYLHELPHDILLEIFEYVSEVDLWRNVRITCCRFNSILRANTFWLNRAQVYFFCILSQQLLMVYRKWNLSFCWVILLFSTFDILTPLALNFRMLFILNLVTSISLQ